MEIEVGTLSLDVIEMELLTISRCGGIPWSGMKGLKGIMGHGCSVCEGQHTWTGWLKSLACGM
jgi:hypothetical protein